WGLITEPLIIIVNHIRYKRSLLEKNKGLFLREYKELLISVSGSLQSGYSVENSFREAEESLSLLYGRDSRILEPLRRLNGKVAMRQPIENAFYEFADDYPLEEVTNFSLIFGFGKRLGGDYIKNLRRTVEKIEESIELKQEIATSIAEKRMELKVMSVMPISIIAYIKLGSPEFISSMYHSPAGILIMTLCIAIYALAIFIGNAIVNIKV
ncbi:MAG: hypothetical protein J6N76_03465, partial [Lachnospiraceae bacterium]|nr:hypothetical protein [Lachnospiraceae bacterium]